MEEGLSEQFRIASQPFCHHMGLWEFDYAVNISLQYNYLFVETPKVACTFIKAALQRMELDNPDALRSSGVDIHHRHFSPLIKPSQIRDLANFIAHRKLFTFCFCRNPYTRLLSAYLNKVAHAQTPHTKILDSLGMKSSQQLNQLSFEAFIGILAEHDVRDMNLHWRPQYYQTFQDAIDYDFIGRIESLDTDLDHAFSRIRSDYAPFLSHNQNNTSDANRRLHHFYTPDLTQKIQQLYAIDFEYFGYDTDLPKPVLTS